MPAATLRAHCEKTTREDSVEREIRTMLELNGWRTHKLEVFKGRKVQYEDRTRTYTEGTKGQADLLAVHPAHPPLYIECKRPRGGRYSTDQLAWQAVARKDGFVVLNARSWRELVARADALGVTVERRF